MYCLWLHFFFSHGGMDPHFIGCGHILGRYLHGSAVYFLAAMPHFHYRAWVCLPWAYFSITRLVMVTSYFLYSHNISILFIKCFGHHTYPLTSHFRGHMLSNKIPPSIVLGSMSYNTLSPWVFSHFLDHYDCITANYSLTCDYITSFYTLECDIITTCITLCRDDLEVLFWEISFEMVSKDENNPKYLEMRPSRWYTVSYLISNLIPSTL